MATVTQLVLNPFQENTFLIYDETKECIIIDPGCYSEGDQNEFTNAMDSMDLTPVHLLNTHCHVDHALGNKFIFEQYKLLPEIHKADHHILDRLKETGATFGIDAEPSPEPKIFLNDGDTLEFGATKLQIIHTPGHSPGSISLFCAADKFVIVGDVLFNNGIGRYDFPDSNYQDLMVSITEKLLTLGDDVVVHSGHGPSTTIGQEKMSNPFVNEYLNS